MTINFTCACVHKIKAKDEYAGRASFCPACKEPVLVPELSPVQLTVEPPPPPTEAVAR